jgi:hypothetical protein
MITVCDLIILAIIAANSLAVWALTRHYYRTINRRLAQDTWSAARRFYTLKQRHD